KFNKKTLETFSFKCYNSLRSSILPGSPLKAIPLSRSSESGTLRWASTLFLWLPFSLVSFGR
ncbi:MAG: hypothetical protein MK234_04020, partial [Nitrospinales bacterium]|nr:hypothetical protein [Nitrospinales bacterium]